jgi:hypothetical protein
LLRRQRVQTHGLGDIAVHSTSFFRHLTLEQHSKAVLGIRIALGSEGLVQSDSLWPIRVDPTPFLQTQQG